MQNRRTIRLATAVLLGGASMLSLSTAAQAQRVIFSTAADFAVGRTIAPAEEVAVQGGTVQLTLPGNATASFVDNARFAVRVDGSLDLRAGSVTLVVAEGAGAAIHLPDGVRGSVSSGGAGSFTATASGSRGSTASGSVTIISNGATRTFSAGQFWTAGAGRAPDRVVAGVAAAVPAAGRGSVRSLAMDGIVAAAENGIPVALGEGLAGVGARGDIIAAARRIEAYDANPSITAFPAGDYAALVQYAAQANGLLGAGGTAFRGAGADIILAYFQYLAGGGAPASFRSAYAQILLNYLDLLRSGALPSSFSGATQAQLSAYLAFIGRTDGFGSLSAANQQLLNAYLAFLSSGGSPNAFGTSLTNLTAVFLDFVRGGGNPAQFSQASASVVAQYLAIVNSGALRTSLSAQNQALLAAYLANNGIGFTGSYATSLAAFVAFLNAGGLPSAYAALPADTVRSYLQLLESTGLFDSVLGGQAAFLRSYLQFLAGGGTPDQFNQLPINIARVNAANLTAYVDYLLAGGAPTAYGELTQAQIRAALDQLTATGQFSVLLGLNAAFLAEYYDYIRTGADPDAFAGLPSVDVNAYATALAAFAAYLRAGNLPSGYGELTAQQIRSFLTALQVSGQIDLLGDNAALLGDYLAYLRTGGAPDAFAGLPLLTYQGYAAALASYFSYLNAGGLPSGYATLTQAQIQAYLDVLNANGQLALLGANASFFTQYLEYLAGGGAADAFAGLPIVTYQGYAAALAAYLAYLNEGGLPSGYTALTAAQIRAYLDVLAANGQLTALLGANAGFFQSYLAFVAGGGSPDAFTGLPSVTYAQYGAALQAFIAFLNGGGLPAGYAALTADQIRDYLAVLQANGQLARIGSAADQALLTAYAAFLAGGGVPDRFPGLPVFASYEAALRAYYAFLQAGGRPSGYTALSQAQLLAYFQALDAAGIIAARLSAAEAEFLRAYAAYVAGGNNPDQYAGLPANQGPNAPVVAQGLGSAPRSNGDGAVELVGGAVGTNFASAVTTAEATISGEALTAFQSNQIVNAETTTTVEARTVDGTVAIARWGAGTYRTETATRTLAANEGVHFVWGTPATALPTSGSATFGLVTATSPTVEGGAVAPGSFTGNLGVNFATQRIGLDSRITIGGVVYGFATAGGAAAPSLALVGTGNFNGVGTTANLANSNGLVNGFLSGNGGALAGLIYQATLPIGDVSGTAIFGRNQAAAVLPAITYTGVAPGYTYTPGLPNTGLRLIGIVPQSNNESVHQLRDNVSATPDASGALPRINGSGSVLPIVRTSAQSLDVAGNARVVVGRWSNGRITPTDVAARDLSANQGYHYALLAPLAFTPPTSGRVDYTLSAATKPTYVSGASAPGVFDASLSVVFRPTSPLVGLQGSVVMPESGGAATYSFVTAGGIANPSATSEADLSLGYLQFSAPVTGSGQACPVSCTILMFASLTGSDALALGATYRIYDNSGQSFRPETITGTAAFTGTAAGGGTGGDGSTSGTASGQVTFVYSGGSLVDAGAGDVVYQEGRIRSYRSVLTGQTVTAGVTQEGGRLADVIGWARWTGDTAGPVANQGPNAGAHVMSGTPTSMASLPTSGTATYTLADSTKPSLASPGTATGAPGVITGSLAVAYGAAPRVGFDLTATAGSHGWRVATPGGSGNPGQSNVLINNTGAFSGSFNKSNGTVTATTESSCVTACAVTVGGQLFGAGGSHAGVAFNAIDSGPGGTAAASGVAIFTRNP